MTQILVRLCPFPNVLIHVCLFLSIYVCFHWFLSVSVCFCLFLSVSVWFCLFPSVSVSFCPFLSTFDRFCPFLSYWLFFCYWCYYAQKSKDLVSSVRRMWDFSKHHYIQCDHICQLDWVILLCPIHGKSQRGWGRSWINVIILKFSAIPCDQNELSLCKG